MGSRIIGMQQRAREIGRIRLGKVVPTSSGKTRPSSIETFRFTSMSKEFVEWAAAEYGGNVSVWESPAGSAWEVETAAKSIEVAIPSWGDPISQAYELWSGGGCMRRCDGMNDVISDGPCVCNAEARECKPTLRVSLILPKCPIMGVVRLETHGFNANAELPSMIDGLSAARAHGINVRATLRVEPRTSKKDGETMNYVVPVLDVQMSLDQLESGEVPQSAQVKLPSPAKQIESHPHQQPPVEDEYDGFRSSEDDFLEVVVEETLAVLEDAPKQDAKQVISEAQIRRMFAIARKSVGEDSGDVVKRVVKWLARVESSKDIPKRAYDTIIVTLEGWPDTSELLLKWEAENK